jgi:hypothetical protein
MEERKQCFDDKTDVRAKLGEVAKTLVTAGGLFDGVHVFTGHGDVPVALPIRGTVDLGTASGGSSAARVVATQAPKAKSYHGTADVTASMAKMRLTQLAEEIINVLVSDPNAVVKVTVEIQAEFPNGVSDQVKRAVSENSKSLGLKANDWE